MAKKQKNTSNLPSSASQIPDSQPNTETPSFFDTLTHKQGLSLVLGIATLFCFLLFYDFIRGKNVYLFEDIGSDSIQVIYPNLVHLYDYISQIGMPSWSFKTGMGQSIYPFWMDPIPNLSLLFGRDNIAYMMVWVHIVEILLAAFIIFQYLRLLKLSGFYVVLGSLCFAFCAYMVLGGGWDINRYGAETLNVALLLYALEQYLQHKRWAWLPIPMFLFALQLPFQIYIYTVFTIVYVAVRYTELYGFRAKNITIELLKIGALYALGMGMGTLMLPANVLQLIDSPRGLGGVSHVNDLRSMGVFHVSGFEFHTAISRFFSNSLIGGPGDLFKGWGNFMESPMAFCGIVPMLALPQFLALTTARNRKIYGLLLLFCSFPMVFGYFRMAFWLFTGNYYRSYGFFWVILQLLMGLRGMQLIYQQKKINYWVLAATILFWIVLLSYPYVSQISVKKSDLTLVYVFVVLYGILLVLFSKAVFQKTAQWALLITVLANLYMVNYATINKRKIVKADTMTSEYYTPDYQKAIAYVKEKDKGFFRLENSSPVSPNDGKALNYNSIKAYSSFNQMYYAKFCQEMDIIAKNNEEATRRLLGVGPNLMLMSLCAIKYVMVRDTADVKIVGTLSGFKPFVKFGNYFVFENTLALPLGVTFDHWIDKDEASKISKFPKHWLAHRGVMLEKQDMESLKIPQINLSTIDTVGIMSYPIDSLTSLMNETKKERLQIKKQTETSMEGTLEVSKPKLLFFSIPYDRGWHIKVNGQEEKILIADFGFMALPVQKGKYQIELVYEQPFMKIGYICTIVFLLVYVFLLWKFGKPTQRETKVEPATPET